VTDPPQFIEANGVRLAVFEHPGADPPILFAHATGFHARCWNQIIARIPDRRSIAVDMRGHGLSSKPAPPYEWHTFGEDVAALARALDLRGATGVGHSMGGHSVTLAATIAPEAFGELILIDPVIMPLAAYLGRRHEPHFARKRRNEWGSPDEMFERFKGRPPFVAWDPAVLRDYCDDGLIRVGDGYVLACPPEIEASIYEASGLDDANLHGILGGIDVPVTVIRSASPMRRDGATMDMAASPTAPDLARDFRHGKDVKTPYSHFIPMEAPAFIAGRITETAVNSTTGLV
jgi:lipase